MKTKIMQFLVDNNISKSMGNNSSDQNYSNRHKNVN